jgi:hypothetical protein
MIADHPAGISGPMPPQAAAETSRADSKEVDLAQVGPASGNCCCVLQGPHFGPFLTA